MQKIDNLSTLIYVTYLSCTLDQLRDLHDELKLMHLIWPKLLNMALARRIHQEAAKVLGHL